LINTYKGKIKLETLIHAISTNPRKIFKLNQPKIAEGEIANLTIFNPKQNWVFEKKHIQSKSANTPFIGTAFIGKVIGIINNKQSYFNK
jgi:dihydroorotase